jgi:ribosomal protein S1
VVENVEVLSVADYGAFVRLAEGIEAIIPANEIPTGVTLRAGEKTRAEVSNIDAMDRRVTMTLRNVGESPQAEQLEALKREQGKGATLGDVLKGKLGDKLQSIAGSGGSGDTDSETKPS